MKKFKALFSAICMSLFIMSSITAYAEETQTYSWVQEGEVWKLKDAAGNYVVNDWFKDATGTWYFMGADGAMLDGILNDNGHYYFLQTALEGQGKMVTVDGVYNGVNLTFNQDVNSTTYGEITSGAQALINTGIRTTNLTITTTRTVATTPIGGSTEQTTTTQQRETPSQQWFDANNPFADWDTHADNLQMGDWGDTSDLANYANNRY